MTSDLLIFDGDDTLWHAEELYDNALAAAEHAIDSAGLDGARWRTLQREIDLANVATYGMSPTRFPTSSETAIRRLEDESGKPAPPSLVDEVVDLSRSVFTTPARPVDNVLDVLTDLSDHFTLALMTKGDPEVQQRRVEDSGLRGLFEKISIVASKSEAEFSALVDWFAVEPRSAWSIGNSLPSDINPALRIGMNAIWVDAHVWEHERRETAPVAEHLIVLASIRSARDFLFSRLGPTAHDHRSARQVPKL